MMRGKEVVVRWVDIKVGVEGGGMLMWDCSYCQGVLFGLDGCLEWRGVGSKIRPVRMSHFQVRCAEPAEANVSRHSHYFAS